MILKQLVGVVFYFLSFYLQLTIANNNPHEIQLYNDFLRKSEKISKYAENELRQSTGTYWDKILDNFSTRKSAKSSDDSDAEQVYDDNEFQKHFGVVNEDDDDDDEDADVEEVTEKLKNLIEILGPNSNEKTTTTRNEWNNPNVLRMDHKTAKDDNGGMLNRIRNQKLNTDFDENRKISPKKPNKTHHNHQVNWAKRNPIKVERFLKQIITATTDDNNRGGAAAKLKKKFQMEDRKNIESERNHNNNRNVIKDVDERVDEIECVLCSDENENENKRSFNEWSGVEEKEDLKRKCCPKIYSKSKIKRGVVGEKKPFETTMMADRKSIMNLNPSLYPGVIAKNSDLLGKYSGGGSDGAVSSSLQRQKGESFQGLSRVGQDNLYESLGNLLSIYDLKNRNNANVKDVDNNGNYFDAGMGNENSAPSTQSRLPISSSAEKHERSSNLNTIIDAKSNTMSSTKTPASSSVASKSSSMTVSNEQNIITEQHNNRTTSAENNKLNQSTTINNSLGDGTEEDNNNGMATTKMRTGIDMSECTETIDPNNATDVLERVLQELELLRQMKNDNGIVDGMPCLINGSWNSETIGMRFDIKFNGNDSSVDGGPTQLQLNVSRHDPPKRNVLMDANWILSGYSLHMHGGPFYIAATKSGEDILATFNGICKTCGGLDTIFGTWSFAHPAKDCRDLQMSIETKRDIFHKEMLHIKRVEKLENMKMRESENEGIL